MPMYPNVVDPNDGASKAGNPADKAGNYFAREHMPAAHIFFPHYPIII